MGRLLIAAALLVPLSGPAAAQDLANASEAVRLFAESAPSCVVTSAASASGAVNAIFSPEGTGGGAVAITQLVDPQTSQPRAASIELALPVVCNAAHRLLVTSDSGGLLREGGRATNRLAPQAFGDLLPYEIDVDWGTDKLAGNSADGGIETAQPAQNGELRLRIGTAEGGGLLTAGNYTDTVTIRFEPAS